ncbi:MAG: thiamine-phosphate kinase [Actinomycetota bacterium]
MELPEDELIAAIARVLSGEEPGVVVGLGDDAAVLEPGSGHQLLTTDLLIEGVHFEVASISARDLGAKAVTVNVSDIAAMGGSPRAAVVSIALTPDVEAAWVIELTGGMRDACGEYALSLVGGDTNRGDVLVVAVTVLGEVAPGRAVTRSGARVGDAIVVTGSLGAAAGGLAVSRTRATETADALSHPWGRVLLDALARPVARVGEGQALASLGVGAMMDLSDGLAKDLSRLCLASGVGARVELPSVPVSPALRDAAPSLGVDALELAVGGGEDYELLATLAPATVERARAELADRFGVTLTAVGSIVEGTGVTSVDADGREAPLEPTGWDHFA